ncbi:MAG: PEP-utilizing enzyme, partial [Kiloniellales bacterium]|nr:PEP-utilizing enzyme [Kiloniellales bacterium]
IGYAARRKNSRPNEKPANAPDLQQVFAGRPVRRAVASCLIAWAKARVRDRENLRFERTRLFARVRKIFLAIGEGLARESHLEKPRDIFFLEVRDVLGFVEGTTTCGDLRSLADLRRLDAARFLEAPVPPNRFETIGPVGLDLMRFPPYETARPVAPGDRTGVACCQGLVKAKVRVIRDPRRENLIPGEILVAAHTDPGWIAHFSNAAGILVERGSLLSHSAIVAREMSIPAIVSIPGLMEWLESGEIVEMDGSTGRVSKVADHARE